MNCCVPNKTITINDKEAPWITPEVKQAIKKNHRVYSKWKGAGKPEEGRNTVKAVKNETDRKIENAKSNYHKDLECKLTNSKILMSFGQLLIVLSVIRKWLKSLLYLRTEHLLHLLMKKLIFSMSTSLHNVTPLKMIVCSQSFALLPKISFLKLTLIKVATKGLGLLKFLSKFMNRDKLNLMYKMYTLFASR